MKAIDWRPIMKKYPGQYVALKDDEITVIASHKSIIEAHRLAQAKGYANPIMLKVPKKVQAYA